MGSREDEEQNSLEASHWQEPHFLWRTSKKVAAGQEQTENWPSSCLLTGQLTQCLHACGKLTQELDLAEVKQAWMQQGRRPAELSLGRSKRTGRGPS